jgi:hypothetical protein
MSNAGDLRSLQGMTASENIRFCPLAKTQYLSRGTTICCQIFVVNRYRTVQSVQAYSTRTNLGRSSS